MLSVDTNLLLYSLNADCAEFERARDFVRSIGDQEIAICELVLVELYLLLRNPAVVAQPCSAPQAAAVCQTFRGNRKWRLVECAPVMRHVWSMAKDATFARRRIIDARLAMTLLHHGVTDLATRNTRDFESFGFDHLINPLD